MGEFAIGELCAGECAKEINGISYTCRKCRVITASPAPTTPDGNAQNAEKT